jgi:replicative DNA helicase
MIDYLGLLPIDRKRDRREQVEGNSNAIKEIALRYKIPVILLAQLNRESSREGKEPQLHHLRETGAIEQDADNVMFLHQPQGTMGIAGEVKLIMRKQRNGEVGNVSLRWTPDTLRFDTLDTRAGVQEDEEFDFV